MDLSLSEEHQELRELAASFATRSVAPVVEHADREADGHVDAEAFRGLSRQAAGAGLLGLLIPEEYGGGGQGALAAAVVGEELGAVDAGIASSLNLSMCVPGMIVTAGTAEQKERLLRRATGETGLIISGALSEADVAGSELFDPEPEPTRGLRTKARRDGEEWVLSGAKSGWVSNGGVADAYVVFARTEPEAPAATGTTAFWVPADTPGVVVGSRTSFLGLRSSWHGQVSFDGVRLPGSAAVGAPGQGLALMQSSTASMVVGLAAAFVGLARHAYEMALTYAGERRSWGRPIREHQAVALLLADAATEYRRARLAVLEAAWTLEDVVAGGGSDPALLGIVLPSCKQHAVDAAIANAERCVKIFGASGVATGVGPEKLLRDAWTGWSCDFTGDLLRLSVAAALPR